MANKRIAAKFSLKFTTNRLNTINKQINEDNIIFKILMNDVTAVVKWVDNAEIIKLLSSIS